MGTKARTLKVRLWLVLVSGGEGGRVSGVADLWWTGWGLGAQPITLGLTDWLSC